MGRIGYLGCLVVLGVILVGVGCLAVFSAAGAIDAQPGARPQSLTATPTPRASGTPLPATPAPAGAAPKPTAVGTLPPLAMPAGPETDVSRRLDAVASGGGLKLTALGASKKLQDNRAIIAIYVRLENEGSVAIRVDPKNFRMTDGGGGTHQISPTVEQMFPPAELSPRASPGEPGKLAEGILTFDLPRAARGLMLVYETSASTRLTLPLPPEFG